MTKAEPIGAHWERAREILYLPPSDEQTAIAQLLAERDSARAELAAEVERRRAAEAELLRLSALLDNRNQPISPPYSPAVMRFQCADAIRALLPPAPEEGG